MLWATGLAQRVGTPPDRRHPARPGRPSRPREGFGALLTHAREQLGDATIYGGCLCSCNGRGQNLFGSQNHDAQMVQQRLGPLGLAGFFCNGEIGPVGEKSFLHGYTASLALFVKKSG